MPPLFFSPSFSTLPPSLISSPDSPALVSNLNILAGGCAPAIPSLSAAVPAPHRRGARRRRLRRRGGPTDRSVSAAEFDSAPRLLKETEEAVKMQDGSGRDLDHVDVGSSLPRLGKTRSNLNLSISTKFARSTSLSGITGAISSRERVKNGFRQNSFGTLSSSGSSQRSYIFLSRDVGDQIVASINLSRNVSQRIFEDVDSSLIAQAGDTGDRVVVDHKEEDNMCSMDKARALENGALVFADETLTLSNSFKSCSATPTLAASPTDAVIHILEKNQKPSSPEEKLPRSLDYISYMIHLAVFGMLGVFTRYLLEKLFGPSLLALTGDRTPLYLDLPANMVGSFLMGWFGIVFKADIRNELSDHIVVGLTTGYLGSLTTFSGWNQKMIILSSEGDWVFALAGIILGMLLVNESIRVGVESADALHKYLFSKFNRGTVRTGFWRVDNRKKHIQVMIVLQLVLIFLYGLSGILSKKELDNVSDGAIIWVGSLVGPFGVWGRWYLARLNGRGIGRKGWLNWLPVGTLLANVLAASFMAALYIVSKVVNKERYGIVISGIEFGFLGCLSTVSTFVAEVYAMRQSGQSGRALAYAVATILISFLLGTLIYSVPIWTKGY